MSPRQDSDITTVRAPKREDWRCDSRKSFDLSPPPPPPQTQNDQRTYWNQSALWVVFVRRPESADSLSLSHGRVLFVLMRFEEDTAH